MEKISPPKNSISDIIFFILFILSGLEAFAVTFTILYISGDSSIITNLISQNFGYKILSWLVNFTVLIFGIDSFLLPLFTGTLSDRNKKGQILGLFTFVFFPFINILAKLVFSESSVELVSSFYDFSVFFYVGTSLAFALAFLFFFIKKNPFTIPFVIVILTSTAYAYQNLFAYNLLPDNFSYYFWHISLFLYVSSNTRTFWQYLKEGKI